MGHVLLAVLQGENIAKDVERKIKLQTSQQEQSLIQHYQQLRMQRRAETKTNMLKPLSMNPSQGPCDHLKGQNYGAETVVEGEHSCFHWISRLTYKTPDFDTIIHAATRLEFSWKSQFTRQSAMWKTGRSVVLPILHKHRITLQKKWGDGGR